MICNNCQKDFPNLYAKGLCSKCYNKEYSLKRRMKSREGAEYEERPQV